MPVSKKRKKDGKPVQAHGLARKPEGDAGAEPAEGHPGHPQQRAGKPKNPFVAHQPQLRGSQRGR